MDSRKSTGYFLYLETVGAIFPARRVLEREHAINVALKREFYTQCGTIFHHISMSIYCVPFRTGTSK